MKEASESSGAILLCGGKGARFTEAAGNLVPKSLFKVDNKPLLLYSIDALPYPRFTHLVLAVDHLAETFYTWRETLEVPHSITFSCQNKPGILNAITCAMEHLPGEKNNAVCNTDEVRLGLDITEVVEFHKRTKTLGTLVVTSANNLHRHGVLTVREHDSLVTSFQLKPPQYRSRPEAVGLVYTGIMLLDKRAVEYFDESHDKDWMGLIDPLCDAGQLSAYVDPNIIYFNVGTKQEYEEAELFFRKRPLRTKAAITTPIFHSPLRI